MTDEERKFTIATKKIFLDLFPRFMELVINNKTLSLETKGRILTEAAEHFAKTGKQAFREVLK